MRLQLMASISNYFASLHQYRTNTFKRSICIDCQILIAINNRQHWGSSQPVMINGTIGALSENSITWVEGGVECFLVSETLDTEQLVSVAASVSNLAEK